MTVVFPRYFRSLIFWLLAACCAAVTSLPTVARAAPIPNLFNSGVDNLGVVLSDGLSDTHYKVIASDDVAFPPTFDSKVVSSPLPFSWLANSATSKWIAPRTDQSLGNAVGTYIYRLTFDMTGLNPVGASITGQWAMDDIGLIFLNGTYTGNTNLNGPSALTPFTVTSGFASGINHLDFIVVNDGAGSTGVRIEIDSSNAELIPEPATLVLAAMALVGFFYLRRRVF